MKKDEGGKEGRQLMKEGRWRKMKEGRKEGGKEKKVGR